MRPLRAFMVSSAVLAASLAHVATPAPEENQGAHATKSSDEADEPSAEGDADDEPQAAPPPPKDAPAEKAPPPPPEGKPAHGLGEVDKPPAQKSSSKAKSSPRLQLVVPQAETERRARTEQELRDRIEARARFVRDGDFASADAELAFILESRQALGARNVVVASAALVHEANQAESHGRVERAIELAETAAKLSPDLATVHWLRTRLYFSQDFTQLARIGECFSDFLRATFTRLRNSVALLSNVAAALAFASLATIATFTLIQLYKYVRYVGHDFAHFLPSWVATGEGVMLLSIGIAMPLAFGFGIGLTIALALGVVYAYQSPKERHVSILSWSAIALTPVLIWIVAPLVSFHGSIVDAIDTSLSEVFAYDAEAKLLEASKTGGGSDFASAIALAQRYRMRGDLKSAEAEYRRALNYEPQNVVARNNLGTLLYQQGLVEAAFVTFQGAAANEQLAEPILNYASVLVDSSQFTQADEVIARARRIDAHLTDNFTRTTSSLATADKLLTATLDQSVLWGRLFDVDPRERMQITEQMFRLIGGRTPLVLLPGLVVMVAVFAHLLSKQGRKQHRFSIACPKCGVPARRDAPAQYCDQCQSVFLNAIAVEPLLRVQKEGQVVGYQRRRRWTERALSVFAGAGDMFAGRPWVGMVLFFIFALALSVVRFTDGFVVHAWSVGVDSAAQDLKLFTAGGVAALLAVFSLHQSFK